MKEITKSYAIKRIADLQEENNNLKQQLLEQPKQIIQKIIEEYNLTHTPRQNSFGDIMFGYATINADNLKEFLDNLLMEYNYD